MTYDGHGRLLTSKAPEQTSPTSYTYNPDDTTNVVTDARGASQSFTYNQRHQVSGITYSAPSGIPVPSPVSFGYDAAGNRTGMTDGTGSVSYSYNQLSQLITETRQFNGLSGSYPLSYEYTLSGQLKKVTDERAGTSFTSAHDQVGRTTGVSGIGFGGTMTQFTSEMRYRAWGALKSLSYGNGTNLSLSYNGRGLVTNYSVGTVQFPALTPTQTLTVSASYQYYADGRVKFAQDQSATNGVVVTNSRKDRLYSYDHAGRLAEAYSGTEARDALNNVNTGVADGAYRQSYTYDVWDQMLSGGGRFWSRMNIATASYNQSGRNPAWDYDAEGHLLSRNEPADNPFPYEAARSSYDAAGRAVSLTQKRSYYYEPTAQLMVNVFTNRQEYDADGQMVRYEKTRAVNGSQATGSPIVTYYLRSSVLGGRVISEYDAGGVWKATQVYAGGEMVGVMGKNAEGTAGLSSWQQSDPVTGDELTTIGGGAYSGQSVFDPSGVEVGQADPFPADGDGDDDGVIQKDWTAARATAASLFPIEGAARCVVDGIEMDCSFVRSEASVACRDGWCGMRVQTVTGRDRDGRVLASSSRNIWPGEVGWDGSLDGRYLRDMPGDGASIIWGGSRFNRVSGGAVSFSHAQLPQNPERRLTPYEVQKLSGRVQQLLTQKCKDFIKQLINKAAEQTPSNPAHDTDVMKLFNKIQSQKGFIYRSGWGTIGGYIHNKDARVYLGGYQPFRSVVNQLDEAHTAIHEIIHQAGKYWYGDKAMARAIIAIRQEQGLSVNKTQEEIEYMLRPTTPLGFASDFWDVYLREACGSRR